VQKKADLIAAIATPVGQAGIGVIRLSGDIKPLANLASSFLPGGLPPARIARHTTFLASNKAAIDSGIALYFSAPASFTGEHVLELQGHGGQTVMQMLLSRCIELGARIAEAGEFSLRAFLNGKLDLVEAEAVADLIAAGSSAAARSAMRSLSGEFSAAVHSLTDELTELRLRLEASIDFPEEEIEVHNSIGAQPRLNSLQKQLKALLQRASQGHLLQHGLEVVLAGQPNVGKSSLLNSLAEEDVAIVTPVAGTTRDVLRSQIQIEGIPLYIVDTAGLRDSDDIVEQIGVSRAWQALEKADFALLVVDARVGETELDTAIRQRLPASLPLLIVHNKSDLSRQEATVLPPAAHATTAIRLSAITGDGIDLLKRELLRLAGWQPTENVFIARGRHLQALSLAQKHMKNATLILKETSEVDMLAEELRLAQLALGEITGELASDDLLGEIFSRFCIGK